MSEQAKKEYFTLIDTKSEEDKGMQEYHKKECSACYKNKYGGFVVFDKPRIETHFCFGYGQNGITSEEDEQMAADREEYARKNSDYFLNENLKKLRRDKGRMLLAMLNLLHENDTFTGNQWENLEADRKKIEKQYGLYYSDLYNLAYFVSSPNNNCGVPYTIETKIHYLSDYTLQNEQWRYKDLEIHKMTLEEISTHLNYIDEEISKLTKRLLTYLKRYGLTKLNTWTYLID